MLDAFHLSIQRRQRQAQLCEFEASIPVLCVELGSWEEEVQDRGRDVGVVADSFMVCYNNPLSN